MCMTKALGSVGDVCKWRTNFLNTMYVYCSVKKAQYAHEFYYITCLFSQLVQYKSKKINKKKDETITDTHQLDF